MYLLYTAHITTVNGGAFGNDKCVRMSFAAGMELLQEAMERMRVAIGKLK
jgi:aspartate aminotransferase